MKKEQQEQGNNDLDKLKMRPETPRYEDFGKGHKREENAPYLE